MRQDLREFVIIHLKDAKIVESARRILALRYSQIRAYGLKTIVVPIGHKSRYLLKGVGQIEKLLMFGLQGQQSGFNKTTMENVTDFLEQHRVHGIYLTDRVELDGGGLIAADRDLQETVRQSAES
jgi:hypothetical protein